MVSSSVALKCYGGQSRARVRRPSSPIAQTSLVALRRQAFFTVEVTGRWGSANCPPSARIAVGWGSLAPAGVESAVEAVRIGANDYVTKSMEADDVIGVVASAGFGAPHGDTRSKTLPRVEWEHVLRVLADCDGNTSEAARRLGIARRTLQRKVRMRPPTQRGASLVDRCRRCRDEKVMIREFKPRSVHGALRIWR